MSLLSTLNLTSQCRGPRCPKSFKYTPSGPIKAILYCSDTCHKRDFDLKQCGLMHPLSNNLPPSPITQGEIARRLKKVDY